MVFFSFRSSFVNIQLVSNIFGLIELGGGTKIETMRIIER